MALCIIEPELLPIEVSHCENRDFRPFCSCDLDLDPMTFIHELDPYFLELYRMCKNEFRTSGLSKVIVWQTCIQQNQTAIAVQSFHHSRSFWTARFSRMWKYRSRVDEINQNQSKKSCKKFELLRLKETQAIKFHVILNTSRITLRQKKQVVEYLGIGDLNRSPVHIGSVSVPGPRLQRDSSIVELGVADKPTVRRPVVCYATAQYVLCRTQGSR